MHLYKMMDDARREQGWPDMEIDWSAQVEEYTHNLDKCLFTTDHGFIAGLVTNAFLLMPNVVVVMEIAWYVEPEHRTQGEGMELYSKLEDWARGIKNCEYIIQGRPTEGCVKVGKYFMRKIR